MIKLLLTLIMMFTFGTSTVNAEENTISIEDRISELAETKSEDSQSVINAKLDELYEDELKAIIANVNELTEPTEDDLTIKEAAISKLEELKFNHLALRVGFIGLGLMFSSFIMLFTRYSDESTLTFIAGLVLIVVMRLLAK